MRVYVDGTRFLYTQTHIYIHPQPLHPTPLNHTVYNRYESILGRPSEALLDAEGRPFTANPEDLFQVNKNYILF